MVRINANAGQVDDLDTELHLFDEDWKFVPNVMTFEDDDTLEYFNDINDKDFRNEYIDLFYTYCPVVLVFMGVIIALLLVASILGVFDTEPIDSGKYQSVIEVQTDTNKLNRVDGKNAQDNEQIGVSKTLTGYFSILNGDSSGYRRLDSYCYYNSNFFELYELYRQKVKSSYDINDCYTRALKTISKQFQLGTINDIKIKDDIYYVYVTLKIPDDSDVTSYMYMEQYNANKFFTSREANKTNMMLFFIESLKNDNIDCSGKEFEIKFSKDADGSFKILDDSVISNSCSDIFSTALYQLAKIAG